MKKLVFLLSLILVGGLSFSQIIVTPTGGSVPQFKQAGSPSSIHHENGLLYPHVGFINSRYADTTSANSNPFIKWWPGAEIVVGNTKWLRSYPNAEKWVQQVSIGGIGTPIKDSAWLLFGNYNTTPLTNWIGTNDSIGWRWKVAGRNAGLILPGGFNSNGYGIGYSVQGVYLGMLAGNKLINDIAAGTSTGGLNTLIGAGAGMNIGNTYDTTTAAGASSENLIITNVGAGSLMQNKSFVTGSGRNTIIGYSGCFTCLTPGENTMMGAFVEENGWRPTKNSVFGSNALRTGNDASYMTSLGAYASHYTGTIVESVTINSSSSDWTTATATFSAPYNTGSPGVCIGTATGTVVINGGVITGVTMTSPGCGYTEITGHFTPIHTNSRPIVTITGDGSSVSATVNLTSGDNTTAVGHVAGWFSRAPKYMLYLGSGSEPTTRYADAYGGAIGYHSGIDASVSPFTNLSNAWAFGKNAKVAASNTMVFGASGADSVKVVINGKSGDSTFNVFGSSHLRGSVRVSNPTNSLEQFKVNAYNGQLTLYQSGNTVITSPYTFQNKVAQIVIMDSAGTNVSTRIKSVYNPQNNGSAYWFPSLFIGDSVNVNDDLANSDVVIGHGAVLNATGTGTAHQVVAIGVKAGRNYGSSTGNNDLNVAIGAFADTARNSGLSNVVIGNVAGKVYTTGSWNTLVGQGAAIKQVTGDLNTYIGQNAASGFTAGSGNIAIQTAGASTSTLTGSSNIHIGTSAGINAAGTGTQNIFIGKAAGRYDSSNSSYNVIIGGNDGTSLIGLNRRVLFADGEGNIKETWDSTGNQFVTYVETRTDSASWKPVVDSAGYRKKLTYWPGGGGSNTDSLFGVQDNIATGNRTFDLNTNNFTFLNGGEIGFYSNDKPITLATSAGAGNSGLILDDNYATISSAVGINNSAIELRSDSILISHGVFGVINLPYLRTAPDLTDMKAMLRGFGGGLYEISLDSVRGSTPTWQQTLTAGSTLTGNNTITGGGYNWTWNNSGTQTFNLAASKNFTINNPTASSYFLFDPATAANPNSEGYLEVNGASYLAATQRMSVTGTSAINFLRVNNFTTSRANEVYISKDSITLSSLITNVSISEIEIKPSAITIRPNLNALYVDSLAYTLSTVGKKIMLRDTATGLVQNIDPALLSAGTVPISSLTAATVDNGIDNVAFRQDWGWSGALDTYGIGFAYSGTTALNNTSVVNISLTGTNGAASRTHIGLDISASNDGTTSTNIGLRSAAQSGTNNYAIIVPASGGSVGIGTSAPTSLLHVNGVTQMGTAGSTLGQLLMSGNTSGTVTIQPLAAAGTYSLTLPPNDGDASQVLTTDGSGVTTWTTPAAGGLTIGTTTIANSITRRVLYDSAGILSNNALFQYNADGELLVGTSTDNGAFDLQTTKIYLPPLAATAANIQISAGSNHGILLRAPVTDIAMYTGSTNPPFAFSGGSLLTDNAGLITWNSTANGAYGAGGDVGIGRNAAGVIEINNGVLTTYRDLKLRHIETTGNISLPSANSVLWPVAGTGINSSIFGQPWLTLSASAGYGIAMVDNGPSGLIFELGYGTYPALNNSTLRLRANSIFNADSADLDFTIRADTGPFMFFAHAGRNENYMYVDTADDAGDYKLQVGGGISVGGHIIPKSNNLYTLGASSGNKWNDIFSYNVTSSAWYMTDFAGASVRFTRPADGQLLLRNEAASSFDMIMLGGTTSSFPALQKSGTDLRARLADGSANTNIIVLGEVYDATGWNGDDGAATKNDVRDKIESMTAGTGTVTDFIFTDANGFDGTVTTSTSTPTLSLITTAANKSFMHSTSGAITGSAMLTQETDQILVTGNSAAATTPFIVNGHEDLTGYIVQLNQSSNQIFGFHQDGYMQFNEIAAPGTPAATTGVIYVKADGLFYGKDDAGLETKLSNTAGGSGTVTNTGGDLTANAVVLGAGTVDTKVSTGITTNGGSELNLGVNATTIGKIKMFGNTSGDATIQPTAVAGTATVQTLPAVTGTLVNRVTTGNGVSASNTDGALAFTLGAITPTTVNGHTFTAGSSTFTGTAAQIYTFPSTTSTLAAKNTAAAASYVNANITIDADGRLTAASNGYGAISPAQITGDQDNWNPSGLDDATTIRISGDATIRAVTSITAPTQVYKPQEKTIINVGTFVVYFPPEHPDGTAANRILNTEEYYLFPGKAAKFSYDITSSRWRILDDGNNITNYTVYYDWSAGSVTSGDVGQMTFLTVGTGTNTATASTTTLPASMLFSTAASATAGFMGYFSKSVVTYSAFATGHNFAEAIVSIPTLSTGTETFFSYLQLTATPSSTTAEVNNSCGIRYNEAVNGGRWQLYTQDNAGAESVADLNITVATATLYKLRIEIDKAKTEVRAYINDVFQGRVTGNMPNSVVMGSRTMIIKTVGTTARTMAIHRQSAGAIH